ncbi:MAG: hypothetical protein QW067_09215 [Thermofilaceae archaeon]
MGAVLAVLFTVLSEYISQSTNPFEPPKTRWPEIVSSIVGAIVGAALAVWIVRKVGNLRKVRKTRKTTSS